MATSTGVPITITQEAAGRIGTLSLQGEIEQIIEHACQMLPELASIQVCLYERYELGDTPGICIDLYGREIYDRRQQEEGDLIKWLVRGFPPEVLQWLIVDYHPRQANAG